MDRVLKNSGLAEGLAMQREDCAAGFMLGGGSGGRERVGLGDV